MKTRETTTHKQIVDTGMALVLLSLILYFFLEMQLFVYLALALLVVNMLFPVVLKPIAMIWLKLSFFLGTIMSTIMLTVVYGLLICPIGITHRLIKGSLSGHEQWKKSTTSVLVAKNKRFEYADIIHPY